MPLAAERKAKIFKNLFLDCGLMLIANGLKLTDLDDDLILINKETLAEQVVGQHPLYMGDFF